MSEEVTTEATEESASSAEKVERTFTQAEVDKIIGERLKREGVADLKAKAQKLDEIEQSSKSELQKAQERISQLEKDAEQANHNALKARIAAEKGVIPEALNGATEDELKASADRLIEWAGKNKRPTPKPSQLASGSSSPKDGERGKAAAALRALRQG